MPVSTSAIVGTQIHPLSFHSGVEDVVDDAERWGVLALHRERVVNLMRLRGISNEDAEDSVHDALLQVVAHPALDHSRAGSLLTVVAMRRAYDRQRERGREQRAVRRVGRLADRLVSPDDVAVDRVEAQALAHFACRLPRRQRDVLGRRAGGLSLAEIALGLGITSKAAESALTRARVALRSRHSDRH